MKLKSGLLEDVSVVRTNVEAIFSVAVSLMWMLIGQLESSVNNLMVVSGRRLMRVIKELSVRVMHVSRKKVVKSQCN
jgi:hypothetical protein